MREENESGFLPPLKTQIPNINQYELIFIGFPTWGMRLPPPMKSFLNDYDLSGKTVIPFNTNAGYGIGSSFKTIEQMCPDSEILEGFSIKGGIERDGVLLAIKGVRKEKVENEVEYWLKQLGLLK